MAARGRRIPLSPIPGEFLSPHENAAKGAKGAAGGNLAGGGKSTAEEARADLADGARDLAKKIGGHEGGLTDPFKILDEFNTIADHAAGLKERVREDIASVAVAVGNAADEELKKKFAEFDAMTRWERTQRLLLGEGGALPKLAEGHDIELLALRGGDANSIWWQRRGGKKTSGDLPGEFGLPADGDGTDLAEAISRALDGQSEGAGVILISDGQHNTDSAPGDVAALLGRNRVPIFAIGTGTDKPTADVSVISVTAPGTVFSEDTVSGQLTINDEMKPGVAYRASIHYGDEMLWEKDFNTTNGSKRVFDYEFPIKKLVEAAEAARDPEKGALRNVPLAFSVKVEPKGGEEELAQIEHVTANNERPMFVQAVTQKRKVLILDGRPRWEMRYLNNQFDRDEQWEATALLDAIFDGKRGWPRGKEGALFPDSKELLFTYDLLVIGDLPGDLLTDEEQEWIKEFAERRGGGIVFVDGQRGHLRDLAKAGAPKAGDAESTPRGMAALFPVEWLPGATGPERGEESMPEKLTLTSDGLDLAALRFASNVQENIDTWEKLRPPHWVARSRPLPGTIVLGRAETKGGDSYPLFAWRRFGAGRVLYCGCDELWRWRYDVADRYHAKFWAQLANWIAEQPFSVAGRVSIGSDKMVYRPASRRPARAPARRQRQVGHLGKPYRHPLSRRQRCRRDRTRSRHEPGRRLPRPHRRAAAWQIRDRHQRRRHLRRRSLPRARRIRCRAPV
ncbi:MAG: VWA domain-containing protein [Verrucomicrobiales bacterium]